MKNEHIQKLIGKFNAGSLTADEQAELEQLIESGEVSLDEITSISKLDKQITKMEMGIPSGDLDDRFYQMLALEKGSVKNKAFSWKKFFSWPELMPKLAFASVALMVGLAIGYFVRPQQKSDDIAALGDEVRDLKEMMMLSLIEKESATERLKAVSLTEEMDGASAKVTQALIRTLNEDSNVNVRLAALEALKPYVKESAVREQIILSIANQKSPMVQIAMAELMVQIQEKSSVKELEKIMKSERTPAEVKKKLKESIQVLS
jgi:hypothetical protein